MWKACVNSLKILVMKIGLSVIHATINRQPAVTRYDTIKSSQTSKNNFLNTTIQNPVCSRYRHSDSLLQTLIELYSLYFDVDMSTFVQ